MKARLKQTNVTKNSEKRERATERASKLEGERERGGIERERENKDREDSL